MLNHKSSSSDPDRVTAVVPLWPNSLGDDRIWTTPIGKNGEGGLKIFVEGNEYAGYVKTNSSSLRGGVKLINNTID